MRKKIEFGYITGWSNAHIWGADIQEEEQTFPTLQPLPSCPENSPSYGLSNIRYNIGSIVVSNTAKQGPLN